MSTERKRSQRRLPQVFVVSLLTGCGPLARQDGGDDGGMADAGRDAGTAFDGGSDGGSDAGQTCSACFFLQNGACVPSSPFCPPECGVSGFDDAGTRLRWSGGNPCCCC